MASNDRAAALARLAELGAAGANVGTAEEPKVERTGEEVYAGGDEARLLVRRAHLSYMDSGVRHYPAANVGDTVLLSKGQAKRLDALGVTASPDVDDEELEEQLADGVRTDDELRAMSAAELVAHVGQHPDDRARVRTLEEEREEKDRRTTVLKATEADENTGE